MFTHPTNLPNCCLCKHMHWVVQVYYFSKFSVKVANKQYATVRNDYELHFDNRCGAKAACDDARTAWAALVSFSPHGCLGCARVALRL